MFPLDKCWFLQTYGFQSECRRAGEVVFCTCQEWGPSAPAGPGWRGCRCSPCCWSHCAETLIFIISFISDFVHKPGLFSCQSKKMLLLRMIWRFLSTRKSKLWHTRLSPCHLAFCFLSLFVCLFTVSTISWLTLYKLAVHHEEKQEK